MEKLFVYDVETTGIDSQRCGIHQLAGKIIIDGYITEDFSVCVQPFRDQVINLDAIAVSGTTLAMLESYEKPDVVYRELISILSQYCNKNDPNDRFHLVGYNNSNFDNIFLREFFRRNNDNDFDLWFWREAIDVYIIAAFFCSDHREQLDNFRLSTVAQYFGINVNYDLLHNPIYDAVLTYQLYLKLKSKIKMEVCDDKTIQENL